MTFLILSGSERLLERTERAAKLKEKKPGFSSDFLESIPWESF